MSAISSESLTKTYSDFVNKRLSVTALNDFTISVERGQIFGLLGPNGAGKTTFIKILLGLVNATSGRANILGTLLPDVKVRERIGYLPENHRYPGYLTGEQVMLLFGGLSGMNPADIKSRAPSLLKLVGMEQWAKMKVKKYSKGMMQRLGLAQSLINNPEVLFLDEPTDGVDPVGRKEIRDVLKNLKSEGKTIFLNSHLLSEVELISDKVAILDKGKLLKVGTVDELTVTDANYEIGFAGSLGEGFYHEAAATVMKFRVDKQSVSAELKDVSELNHLIDMLRRHGIEITHITKKRSSLEDSFINLIKREVAS
ncbi:MAG: ABC transporter ATP-binding protein [Bacteroidetes bacterium]|nr:ABC transporter ATP-binding protein [Bacteroidota bacterium]MCW5897287.1 ABC transporter ATP-binding protein [Bacteroidota bacterium]